MSTPTRLPGKITWHGLATPDPERAGAFYAGLFGWSFREGLILREDTPIASVWAIPPAGPVTPHWSTYVSVTDLAATVAAARAAGGQVIDGPSDLPGLGTVAVLEDPTRATVVACAPAGDDPADRVPGPGEFCWDVLATTDVAAARAFYEQVFGWQAVPMPGVADTLLCKRPDGPSVASLMPVPQPGVPSHWAAYVAVADLAEARGRVTALGGQVVREEIVVPGVGTLAIVQDPTGAYLRLFQG